VLVALLVAVTLGLRALLLRRRRKQSQVLSWCWVKWWWPGTESNCRHADFQSSKIVTQRNPSSP